MKTVCSLVFIHCYRCTWCLQFFVGNQQCGSLCLLFCLLRQLQAVFQVSKFYFSCPLSYFVAFCCGFMMFEKQYCFNGVVEGNQRYIRGFSSLPLTKMGLTLALWQISKNMKNICTFLGSTFCLLEDRDFVSLNIYYSYFCILIVVRTGISLMLQVSSKSPKQIISFSYRRGIIPYLTNLICRQMSIVNSLVF